MIISLIVAMDRRGVIGVNGALPWRLSDDLKHFKAITMGKPIIMGRKTHESIGRPLPGRENIVITRQKNYRAAGCTVFHGIETALEACANHAEVMVMGGASLYEELLPRAARIYLTRVEAEVRRRHLVPAVRHRRLERGRTPGLPGRRAQRVSLQFPDIGKKQRGCPAIN